jgi:uncharacterized membrane protein
MKEISIYIRAHNEATYGLRSVARDIASLGMSAMAVAHLGVTFGLFNKEMGNTIMTVGSVVSMSGMLFRGIAALSHMTVFATAIEWAHNAALAMKVSLMTIGVGLVIALSAYMVYLAAATRSATNAQTDYNNELAKMPTRGVFRVGEEALRRGVEGP